MIFQTETQRLRAQLDDANRELMRRDRAEIEAQIAASAAADVAATAAAVVAVEQATEAEIESHRKSAWLNHLSGEALAQGDATFGDFLMGDINRHCKPGWPPGMEPEMFHVTGIAEPEDISDTILGKAIAAAGGLRL